jgi:ADP-ribose pyrophosphatase YjhB (NUDIX family)
MPTQLAPWLGVDAAVLRGKSILLVRRLDDGLWAMPGGLAELEETPAEAVLRELKEEAGIGGRVVELLGIFDSRLWQARTSLHLFGVTFLVEPDDQAPHPGSEVTEASFFTETKLPALSPGHHLKVPLAFKQLRGEAPVPYFDGCPQAQ